jgi:signal peptidase I
MCTGCAAVRYPDRMVLVRWAAAVAAGAVVVAVAVAARWVRRSLLLVTVEGHSMAPGLADGDRVLVHRVRPGRVRPSDVVVLRRPRPMPGRPSAGNPLLVKRVAAVAGDPTPAGVPGWPSAVPDGYLVVLGDNPLFSNDSRHFGWVARKSVLGVVRRRWRCAPDVHSAPTLRSVDQPLEGR